MTVDNKGEVLRIFLRFVGYFKAFRFSLLLGLLCMGTISVVAGVNVYLVKTVLDDALIEKNITLLFVLPFIIIGIYLINGAARVGAGYTMTLVGQKIMERMRNQVYESFLSLSLDYHQEHKTGSLMSVINNDIPSVQHGVSAVVNLIQKPLTVLVLAFSAIYMEWRLALIAFICLPVVILPMRYFGIKIREYASRGLTTAGSLNTILQETLSGIRIVKAFGNEDREKERFRKENEEFFKMNMKTRKTSLFLSPLIELLAATGAAFVIWFGGSQVIHGNSTPGSLISFLIAIGLMNEPLRSLADVHGVINQTVAGLKRVFEIIDERPSIVDREGARDVVFERCSIEYRGVSFAYRDTPVLRNIGLKIEPGEVVAIVGLSGAGKSTLVNLLLRFYDPSEGSILINGVDIRDMTLRSLRNHIGIVTQEIILFADTVRNNIAYGTSGKTLEEVIRASKLANAHDFILKLPDGYETNIGEMGTKLSGGERQRIAIARAILRDAPILILDEATSSLDSKSEEEVQKGLENLMRNRTTLIIGHRLSTIKAADRIVIIRKGEIVEVGTHETLMRLDDEYRRLYEA